MKRKVVLTMMIAVLALGACGAQEGSSGIESSMAGVESQNQEEGIHQAEASGQVESPTDKSDSAEVSMEALENHAVTPATDFEYSLDGDGIMITKYLGTDEIVVLPEEIDGKKVVSIQGNTAFAYESPVKAIRLSDSVENIECAFMENQNLEYVICGSGLKVLGSNAFCGCRSLKEVRLNEGLEEIEGNAFNCCDSMQELYIPETVNEVDYIAMIVTDPNFVFKGKVGSKAEELATTWNCVFEAVE